jgi:4-methylaminobutanoate oxidase (formaldehyde-forming)
MGERQLPSQATVIVIGGGIVGASVLYHLAKAGVVDAVLLERNALTSGTTGHSAALVSPLRANKSQTDNAPAYSWPGGHAAVAPA